MAELAVQLAGSMAPRVGLCGSVRLRFLLLLFAIGLIDYILRCVLSIAIDGPEGIAAEFGWSNAQKGVAQGAFFYGYASTQLPGGWLATRVGGKRVLTASTLLSCATTLARPASCRVFPLFIAVGVAAGMAQGPLVPAVFSMLGRWVPQDEYAQASFQLNGGMTAGLILAMMLPPLVMRTLGWRWVFYLAALPGLLWAGVWARWVTDSPEAHPALREGRSGAATAELRYLRAAASQPPASPRPTPWGEVLRSPPIWGQFSPGRVCH
jgi:MFS family permease